MSKAPEPPPTSSRAVESDRSTCAPTPAERPVESGPGAGSFQEILTLVGAGRGLWPIGAHVKRYYMRPDVAYVPFRDAPPVHWRLMWRADGATAQVQAFAAAAHDLVTAAA